MIVRDVMDAAPPPPPPASGPASDRADPPFSISLEDAAEAALARLRAQSGGALNIDPDTVERDLTRLVLTLIEFLRQLLEAQAVRRMEKGRLTPEQEDRLGETLMLARERLVSVAAEFGIAEDELTLDLGPFGTLV